MESNFKCNLRSELDYQGLTVKELSSKTGIPLGTLNCYLSARASLPPADIACRIADALDVSVEYLVKGADGKHQFSYNQIIRSIIQILLTLNERDCETVLGLAKVLQK